MYETKVAYQDKSGGSGVLWLNVEWPDFWGSLERAGVSKIKMATKMSLEDEIDGTPDLVILLEGTLKDEYRYRIQTKNW